MAQQNSSNTILPTATPSTRVIRPTADSGMGVISTAPRTDSISSAASSSSNTRGNVRGARQNAKRGGNNNASAKRQSLFWVHSDPQSVAGGAKEDTLKRIRSHVMAEHNRKKRLENTKRPKGSGTGKNLEPLTLQSAAMEASPSMDVFSSPPTSATSSHFDLGSDDIMSSPVVKNSPPSSSRSGVDVLPSPWSYLGYGARDPFNTMHTALSDSMLKHLQYCKKLSPPPCGLIRLDVLTVFSYICLNPHGMSA